MNAPLTIYVDGMFFGLSGIGRVYENLVRALIESEEVARVCTVVPRAREGDFRRAFPPGRIDVRFADFPPLGFSDFFRKDGIIRRFVPPPDLCFFPNFNVPFFQGGRVVSMVHDLIPISPYSDLPAHKKIAFRRLVGRVLRRSLKVVCVSNCTRDHVSATFGILPERTTVIHPWVEDEFVGGWNPDGRGRALVEGDYLLFVGNRFAHKNLRCLIDAYLRVVPEYPGLKAVIAGARMRRCDAVDEAAADPRCDGRIVQFLRASDDEVKSLYAHARAFVFPTRAEGFGIPPLEALSFGLPVICSDIPVMREVCGDAVRYADPSDPESFARQISDVLRNPPGPASREKGRERVRLYGRETALARYMDLFRSCAKIPCGRAPES